MVYQVMQVSDNLMITIYLYIHLGHQHQEKDNQYFNRNLSHVRQLVFVSPITGEQAPLVRA